MSTPNRVRAGVPAGGQFAGKSHPEPSGSLADGRAAPGPSAAGALGDGELAATGLTVRKFPASQWVPDVDGYTSDDGYVAKPCWMRPSPDEKHAGWQITGPGLEPGYPWYARAADEVPQLVKQARDIHARNTEAERFPAAGPGRFQSTSPARRRETHKLREGREPFRHEMRAALSHLGKFKPGDNVTWTDIDARTHAGVVLAGEHPDGRYGSWESYGLRVQYQLGDGVTSRRIECHDLATGRAGLRSADEPTGAVG